MCYLMKTASYPPRWLKGRVSLAKYVEESTRRLLRLPGISLTELFGDLRFPQALELSRHELIVFPANALRHFIFQG